MTTFSAKYCSIQEAQKLAMVGKKIVGRKITKKFLKWQKGLLFKGNERKIYSNREFSSYHLNV
jgi:hypothetical protein